jgi:hypothetical protein
MRAGRVCRDEGAGRFCMRGAVALRSFGVRPAHNKIACLCHALLCRKPLDGSPGKPDQWHGELARLPVLQAGDVIVWLPNNATIQLPEVLHQLCSNSPCVECSTRRSARLGAGRWLPCVMQANVDAWLRLLYDVPEFNASFAPYLALLPKPGELLLPATMCEEELRMLQGGPLVRLAWS